MTDHDKERFSKALFATMEVYGKEISEMVIAIWWNALKQFDIELVCKSLQRHITDPDTGQYIPKPADVIKYLVGSRQGLAMQAWSKVKKSIESIGGAGTVVFDDPLIHSVVEEIGGWSQLCQVLEKELPFKANEFEKRYKSYQLSPPESYLPKLVGSDESHNKQKGFEVADPYLVGDQSRALLTLKNGSKSPRLKISGPTCVSNMMTQLKQIGGAA